MSETEQKKAAFRQRTKKYAARIVRRCCALPKGSAEVQIPGRQRLRSGTSVVANYREASRARSAAEFVSKIDRCAQEADESMLWLELLHEECNIMPNDLDGLLWESNERIAILLRCPRKLKTNNRFSHDAFSFHSPFTPHPLNA